MPQKADVSDWIASGGTADLLRALVDDLGEWTPEPFASRYGLVWFNDLNIDHGAEHAWLIDDWLSPGDVSMNYGASRSGKSFLAIHAAMCVARGIRLFGHDVQRGGVVYQAGEEAKGIKNRFRAYRKHFEVSDNERVPLAVLRSPIDLYRPDGDTAGLVAEIKALAELMPVPLALVVIDTLATATAGADENSAKDMSAVLANIGKIARAGSCHVMLVHHKNASGDKPRGHTSVFANLDNAIEVAFHQSTGLRVASNAKQKDDEEAEPIRFELMRVEIGFRPNGKPITSCVCLPVGEKDAALKAQAAQGTIASLSRSLTPRHGTAGMSASASLMRSRRWRSCPRRRVRKHSAIRGRRRAMNGPTSWRNKNRSKPKKNAPRASKTWCASRRAPPRSRAWKPLCIGPRLSRVRSAAVALGQFRRRRARLRTR
jgi:AAA domain